MKIKSFIFALNQSFLKGYRFRGTAGHFAPPGYATEGPYVGLLNLKMVTSPCYLL